MPWWSSSPAPGPKSVQAEVVAVIPKSSPAEAPVPPPPPGPVVPAVPERFGAVERLSVTELQQLQANVSAMDDLILEESKVKDLLQQLKAVRQDGRSVADAIMDREPKLQEAAADYEGKREALAQLRSSVEAKVQQRQEILQKRSPQRLGVQLNARAQDAEQLAEETLNQALDAGAMDASGLSQFRQQFMQQKMKKHQNLALKSAVESCA
mmetsp:Transcript_81977/g.129622  ORF Transcript_81977/g.129622 Transcript_81977/m.129622 type:complete len:210 (-) Transcript_81977:74-703(-)